MNTVAGCWVVYGMYALAVMGVGFWGRRRLLQARAHPDFEFWAAGRSIPGWRLGVSLASGWLMLGWIGFGMSQIYGYGATGLWLLPIPWFILCWLIVLLVPFFRRAAALSLPEALGRRFGPNLRRLAAFLSFGVFLSWTGAELVMVKTLAAPSLGLAAHPNLMLLAFILPVLVYMVLGGFRSIVATDFLQFAVMAPFMAVLGGWALVQAHAAAPMGVLAALREIAPPNAGAPAALNLNTLDWIFPAVLLIGYLPGWLVEQDLVLRIQAAPTTPQARIGALIGLVLITVFVIAIPAVVAFCALVVFKPSGPGAAAVGADFTGIIAAFLAQMPPGLAVFMFLGVIACQMSTVDTFTNVTAMPLAYDLYRPLFGGSAKSTVLPAKIITAACLLLAVGYAAIADRLGDVYYLSSGVLSASIAVPAIAIFWRRATASGAFTASVLGAVTTLAVYLWEYRFLQAADPGAPHYYTAVLPAWLAGGYGYFYIGAGVLVAALSLAAVSLLQPAPAPDRLRIVTPTAVEGPALWNEITAAETACSPPGA